MSERDGISSGQQNGQIDGSDLSIRDMLKIEDAQHIVVINTENIQLGNQGNDEQALEEKEEQIQQLQTKVEIMEQEKINMQNSL